MLIIYFLNAEKVLFLIISKKSLQFAMSSSVCSKFYIISRMKNNLFVPFLISITKIKLEFKLKEVYLSFKKVKFMSYSSVLFLFCNVKMFVNYQGL